MLVGAFQVVIVICLVGGFLDISYPPLRRVKSELKDYFYEVRSGREGGFRLPAAGLRVRHEPGIRNILTEYKSVNLNISADGRRDNGRQPPVPVRSLGFLLGSSTAFGYGVSDDKTIAAQLEQALPGTHVMNYAGLGQPTSDNVLRWYDLQRKIGNPDFVIIAGVNYQLYADCKPREPKNERVNIFVHLANVATDGMSAQGVSPCASEDGADLAIQNSIMALESAVAFGRKIGKPFYLVYLPTPFDANVAIDNLTENESARRYAVMMKVVYGRYHRELKRLDMPELIDLSDVLPTDKRYFMDLGGHLSEEGNLIVSQALARYIQPAISSRPGGTLKDSRGSMEIGR